MTPEEAQTIIKANMKDMAKIVQDAIGVLHPELAESEDERIRKRLITLIRVLDSLFFTGNNPSKEQCIAYLEKQKEHHLELKAGKWYICHRAFCARADHLTVKEGERFQCEKDGIVKGFVIKEPEKYFKECSAPEPMEKEQKPVDFPTTDEEVNEFLETHPKVEVPEKYKTPDFVFKKQEYESHPIISKDTTSVKPAEWSDEDADMLNCCISSIEEAKENRYAYKETNGDTSYDREIAWLKSLRPVSKESLQSHWKPSEEQMEALERTIRLANFGLEEDRRKALESLHDQLKKLM